jgi:hypothetical protein
MPFGEKKDHDGHDIDFDDIYRFFFRKAIEGNNDLDIDCVRCDEIEEAGSIHEKMFDRIYHSDVVVCDITTANPNVYYELGIRHALAKGVTLLIRRKGTTIPFNIQGMQVVEYDQSRFSSIEQAKARIHQIIKNGLNKRKNDSPVHNVLDLNIEPEGKPIDRVEFYEASLKCCPDFTIGLITGDIQSVMGVDVWVNSENTNMQMARPYENSISGVIRYLGAEKDRGNGQIKTDTIANELVDRMKGRPSVDPSTVIVTGSGSLAESNQVKRIFHAAANFGQVGRGYSPIDQVERCVVNALKAFASDSKPDELQSILFPLMATRSRRGAVVEERIKPLFDAAIDYQQRNVEDIIRDRDSQDRLFRKVYFLTYTDKEFEVCHDLLKADDRLNPLNLIETPEPDIAAETQVTSGSGPRQRLRPKSGGATPSDSGTSARAGPSSSVS